MKNKKIISLSVLAAGLVVGGGAFAKASFTHERFVVVSADEGNYYASITDNMEGTTLLNNLHSIIDTGNVSTSYDWSRYEEADEDPNNNKNVLLIYSRLSMKKSQRDHGTNDFVWNREHTFPNSKITGKAESDNHIIYASEKKVNGTRSSKKMGVVDSGTVVTDFNGTPTTCKTTGSLFDPHNVARGIVARSTMYAVTMYRELEPTQNFESIETMLEWHFEYLPDENDERRNEVVYKNQHNRNPFVDHPEYACRIWGNTNSRTQSICSSATISTLKLSKSSLTIKEGETVQLSAKSSDNSPISWESSNSTIVSISSASSASNSPITLTALKCGSATITARSTVDGKELSKTCAVTVKTEPVLSSITLNVSSKSLKSGDSFQLVASANPKDVPLPTLVWSSNHEDIATVTNSGLVKAVKTGSATITVKTSDEKFSASCIITVTNNSSSGGCGGNVSTTSIVLSTLSILGVGLLLIKRKFSK